MEGLSMKRFLSVFLSLLLMISIIPITELNVDAAGNYEVESNNDYSSADVLTINNSISGKMDTTDDIDMYKITVPSNGKLSVSFEHKYLNDTSSYDWEVIIYQYAGGKYNQLSSNRVAGTSDEIVELPSVGTVSGGIYYIKVSAKYASRKVGVEYNIKTDFCPNDNINPTGSISSTNNVASSQTATLNMSDNIEVAGYYWGTSSSYSNNAYTETSSSSVTKTISNSGTYYLTVRDTSGNLSTTYSITFYKTTLNANGGTVSPSYIITKSGNSFTFPTPSKSNYTYNGWSTSSSASSGSKTITPTCKSTYYAVW